MCARVDTLPSLFGHSAIWKSPPDDIFQWCALQELASEAIRNLSEQTARSLIPNGNQFTAAVEVVESKVSKGVGRAA